MQTLLTQMKRLLLGEILPELKQPPFGFPESFLGEHYECFVTSFSEENDDLAQWRAYGSGEGGYALGFEPEIVDHASNTPPPGSVSLVPVLYHADEQHKLLFEFLNAVVDALEQGLEDQNAPYRGGREAMVLEHASPDYAPGCRDAGQLYGNGRAEDFVPENSTNSAPAA